LKLKSDVDAADTKERQEKLDAEIEMHERKDKLEQRRLVSETSAEERRDALDT